MRFFRNVLTQTTIARCLLIAAAVFLVAGYAHAGIITFSGQDDGAPTTGPFPTSTAAATAFAAAAGALSPIGLITFEDQPLGFNSSFTAAPGVTVNISGGVTFGDGFSGISTTTYGNVFGFNTTPGGAKWFGFPGDSATFSFANPTDYFGFWLTGVQTIFTSALTVSFTDGSGPQVLNAPINVNGGAAYFGFTDAGQSISSITILNTSTESGTDAWGIDDVSYDTTTPEPASLLLLGSGALGLAAMLRRKRLQ